VAIEAVMMSFQSPRPSDAYAKPYHEPFDALLNASTPLQGLDLDIQRFFQIVTSIISYKSYAKILKLPTATSCNKLASLVVNASFSNLLKEFGISNWRAKKRPTLN